MANGFLNIPDWFSWENQGAGIAVAQLTSARPRDLIVMMVDNPPGQNQGLYRVGKHLDGDGNVIDGWTPWMNVPDWFPWENRGAGIAVTDLDGNGQLDLVIFMIDHAADRNHAYYRVGRHLDGDGNVTAGWGDWIEIPNWSTSENQYGNLAIADVNRNGQPDLLVLRIDHPSQSNQKNSAFYRIAWDLDVHGKASQWSDWIQVPDWFSQDNQGAGIAVADIKNRGQLDLVIFQIDNPPELNQAFYKIGENLNAQGMVQQDAWTPWLGVPGWFSWENQGAGIAPLLNDGHRDLVVAMVDNPPQVNSGQYRVLEFVDDPQRVGKWEVLPFDSEVLAIHAALLPTGKVFFYAGSGNSPTRFKSDDFGKEKIQTSVVWDPGVTPAPGTNDNFFQPDTLRGTDGRPLDFFCGGESFLSDGRLLAAGGTHQYSNGQPFLGLKEAGLFDPQAKQWTHAPSMAGGRWYPTLVTLHDGRILAASGLDENNGQINMTLEIYDPITNTWQQPLQFPPGFPGLPLYAHLFELQDGRLFFTGGKMNEDQTHPSTRLGPCLIDISTNPVQIIPVNGLNDPALRNQSASVLLPPAQAQKVMIIGGGPNDTTHPATRSADIIDLSNPHQPNLAYHPAQAMNLARMHLNAVLLPDHTVFVSGGAPKQEMKISASLQSEIYDPATDTWQLAAIAQIPRLYHSFALLLPDGKVIAAGGNPERGTQVQWEPPDPNEELCMELYSPPYLFRSPRPVIDQALQQLHYGQSFAINSSQAGNIQWVSLIRNGVTTHSFNTGQRLVDLAIHAQGNGVITVTTEPNPTIAPPGWYMLFIVNQSKIPSVAKWVHLS